MSDNQDLLDDLVEYWRQREVPDFPRERILANETFVRPASLAKTRPLRPHGNDRRSRWLAVSISVLLASIVFCVVAPSFTQHSFAFEQVQQALRQTRSMSYTITNTGWQNQPWPDPLITKVKVLEPGHIRVEKDGELQITDRERARFVRIQHKERKASVYPLFPLSKNESPPMHNFMERVRNIPASATQKLGERQLNGRPVVDFLWKLDDADCSVSVDAATKLPVRMEVNRGRVGDKVIREVYSDFVFDQPLDAALFVATIPDGYTVEERSPDLSRNVYPDEDAQTLVISPASIGPVTAGMNSDDIVRLLGKPDWIEKREMTVGPVSHPGAAGSKGVIETLEYGSRGFFITVGPNGIFNISCDNQQRTGQMGRDFVGRTKEGLRLGASREDVRDTYGKPESEVRDSLNYPSLGWQFIFKGDKLCSIYTSRPLPPPTGGIQRRILKDGSIIEAVPGIDIDAMIDENGNLKKTPRSGFRRESISNAPNSK